MQLASVRNFRDKVTTYLKSKEPVLVVRHGCAAGILIPFQNNESIPIELRDEILTSLGQYIRSSIESQGISEEDIIKDFEKYREASFRRKKCNSEKEKSVILKSPVISAI